MAIETFGSIIKEEHVKSVERGILANTLVLENLGVFPGYYGANLPQDKLPDSIFLVLTKKISTEKVFRLTHNIKKQVSFDFEGTPSTLCLDNSNYEAIRIRGIKDFDHIGQLQEFYRDMGEIEFAKRKKVESSAVISVKKIFILDPITEEIFKDEERNMYYLKINHQLTWSHFKNVTVKLRNNINLSSFDAALAVIYGSDVIDAIRIYTKTLSMDELKELHAKYNEVIERSLK